MGIWLGIEPRTGEHRVALLDGGPAVRVRTIIRVPDSEKWKADEVLKLKATPKRPNPLNSEQADTKSMRETKGLDVGGAGSKLAETPIQEETDVRSRDFRITQDILTRFGYTEGCVGCEARKSGMDHRNHSATCRSRLEARLSDD